MNKSYDSLHLTANPFPADPAMDPYSHDSRLNGSIFNEDIFRTQLDSLVDKLRRRLNLIYVQSQAFEMGVGKSAVLVWSWRRIVETQSLGKGVYVRCASARGVITPADFAREIVTAWHQSNSLWEWFLMTLDGCATSLGAQALLSKASVAEFSKRYPSPPAAVNIRPFSLAGVNVGRLTGQLTDFACQSLMPSAHEPIKTLIEAYLTKPGEFPQLNAKRFKKRETISFAAILKALTPTDGTGHHQYIFLDQFEEAVSGLSGSKLRTLADGMRILLEGSSGSASFIVTLHPGATQTLNTPEAGALNTLAPLDDRRVVHLPVLESDDDAKALVSTYVGAFTATEDKALMAGSSVIDAAVTSELRKNFHGKIRDILRALHALIEIGASEGVTSINEQLLRDNYRDITGMVRPDDRRL